MTMDYTQLPPPFPEPRMSNGKKLLLLGLQVGLLMLGALMVLIMSDSRDSTNQGVALDIALKWGGPVHVYGPTIQPQLDDSIFVRPSAFDCKAHIETKSLHRNIYEAEVFNANVDLTGYFCKDSVAGIGDTAYVVLEVETNQIVKLSDLKIGEQTLKWSKTQKYLYTRICLSDLPQEIAFASDFDINGSEDFYIKQIADSSTITIEGIAPNPSFKGHSLPNDRSVGREHFFARWEGGYEPFSVQTPKKHEFVGTEFLVGVDKYQQVIRSLKYAFIIICLTYLTVFFTEIVTDREIPLLNYFLIGAALILFYSLLLSFVDHLSFGISYLIASLMTIGLIAGYMWKMLSSKKTGILIGGLLTIMYVSCYILLSLSTYALLLGSMILFVALAAMMYASLQIRHQRI